METYAENTFSSLLFLTLEAAGQHVSHDVWSISMHVRVVFAAHQKAELSIILEDVSQFKMIYNIAFCKTVHINTVEMHTWSKMGRVEMEHKFKKKF